MDESIRRVVEGQFPELTAGMHLPRLAEVVAIREPTAAGNVADPFRPRFAADVRVLDAFGAPDARFPVLRDVPLPVAVGGHEMGFFAHPEPGCVVELGFAFGSPNHPLIRSVQAHGRSLPDVAIGEQRWQVGPGIFCRADSAGNWERVTDGSITDRSTSRSVEALENHEAFTSSTVATEASLDHIVGGLYRLQALTAALLESGGRLDVSGVGPVNVSSLEVQRLRAPKTWIGSQGENVLGLLSEQIALVISLCSVLASHTHAGGSAPDQSAAIAAVGSDSAGIRSRLDGIKE